MKDSISTKSNPSFGRAVYEGKINGPSLRVVDSVTGETRPPQIEHITLEAGRTKVDMPRVVEHRVLSASGVELGYVTDYQNPDGQPAAKADR